MNTQIKRLFNRICKAIENECGVILDMLQVYENTWELKRHGYAINLIKDNDRDHVEKIYERHANSECEFLLVFLLGIDVLYINLEVIKQTSFFEYCNEALTYHIKWRNGEFGFDYTSGYLREFLLSDIGMKCAALGKKACSSVEELEVEMDLMGI
jgi:hypothetical protein